MKYISVDNFVKEVNGKAFDIDNAYGVQCVDGIKKFVEMVYGESNFTCGNGWANGLWLNFKTNGCSKYFIQVPYSQARRGDWIIWDKNSKGAPKSHVAMLEEKKSNSIVRAFGQSQNGIKAFNFLDTYTEGILGVLRPIPYINTDESKKTYNESFLGSKGYLTVEDNGTNVEKLCKFMYDTFPAYEKVLKRNKKNLLGNYYGENIKAWIKEFQKRTNLEQDGNTGPITLSKLKEFGFKE